MRWSGSKPSSSICVRIALNMVSGATRSLSTQASAIASALTRSIQATLSPKDLAPQASHGFDDTNSTSAGRDAELGFDRQIGVRARLEDLLRIDAQGRIQHRVEPAVLHQRVQHLRAAV